MSAVAEVALVAGAAALAGAFAFWTYLRREPPVRGRVVLAILRSGTLVLLVLLFWNPSIRLFGGSGGSTVPRILLDASLSMTARAPAGATAWEEGTRAVAETAGRGEAVLLFGSEVRATSVDSLRRAAPADPESRLAPALERAASLGATSVEVVSDLRLDDPVRVRRVVRSTGLSVRFRDVGSELTNAGIVDVTAPRSLPPGSEGEVEVVLAGDRSDASTPDTVTLELRLEDRLVASVPIPLPPDGRTVRRRLGFTTPERGGVHRLRARVTLEGDVFSADDERTRYLEVTESGAELLFLALRPDWEPRYLLPVLQQVTGLGARGFIAMGPAGWLPMGVDGEESGPVDEAPVREAAEGAEVLVIQGLGADAPSWVAEVATSASRLLVMPVDRSAGEALDLDLGEARAGEWYVSPDVPPSPIAAELAGVIAEGLPPLTDHHRLVTSLPSTQEPLLARRGRSGPLEPVLALLSTDEGRRAVVLASGFWRWAARDEGPREAYRRLWSGVAGWLLEEEEPGRVGGAAVAPAFRPAPLGQEVEWRITGIADSLVLRVVAEDSVVVDTTAVRPGSTLRTPPLPPGRYVWAAEAAELSGGAARGELEVSGYSAELLTPRASPQSSAGGEVRPSSGSRPPGTPLRTRPLPYLLLLGLLCAEWIGRRRQGLR